MGPRARSRTTSEAISLTPNRQSHPVLIHALMNVIPWITIGVTAVFFAVWLLSSTADTAALTIFIMMTLLTAFSWVTRMAVRGLCEDLDDPHREP